MTSKSNRYVNPHTASLMLRVGLAFAFAYAAISALNSPDAWVGFIPPFSTKFVSAKLVLDFVSLLQLFLAVWLLSGKFITYAACLALALLLGIVGFNPSAFIITFRDVPLIFTAFAIICLDLSKS